MGQMPLPHFMYHFIVSKLEKVLDMNNNQQNNLFIVLMEDVCHMCEPIGMYTTYKLAMDNLIFLKANYPSMNFFIVKWDFTDVDSLCDKCMHNLKSLL